MKNRFKTFILCIMALVITSLLSAGCANNEGVSENDLKRDDFNTGKNEIKVEDITPRGWTDKKCFRYEALGQLSTCGGKVSTVVIENLELCKFNLWAAPGTGTGTEYCEKVKDNPKYKKEPDPDLRPKKRSWFKKKDISAAFSIGSPCADFWFRLTSTKYPYCNGRCYGSGGDRVCW